MRFEYILLLVVSVLPLLYQFTFWGSFLRNFKKDDLYSQIFHFWIFIEAPLIILALFSLYNPLFEIFLYNMMFYFLIMYNVFVIGKIFRRKHIFKINLGVFLAVVLYIITGWQILSLNASFVYLYILTALFANIIYFIPLGLIKFSKNIINNGQEDHFEK